MFFEKKLVCSIFPHTILVNERKMRDGKAEGQF